VRGRGVLLALAAALSLGVGSGEGGGLGISVDGSKPMSIESDELEASRREDGRQTVVFKGRVRLSQDDLRIGCDRLEALYGPEGTGAPERITCRGSVTIRQGEIEARCSEASFVRVRSRGVCVGQPAVLKRGANVVEGPEIHFDTQNEKITVKGGVRIRLEPEESAE
jgi:lipopolysaccharide transport protein LptA